MALLVLITSLSMLPIGRSSPVRLAILPSRALDGGTALSATVTEELVSQLGGLDRSRLVVYGSSAGNPGDADYLLESSVAADGDRIRVHARLVGAQTKTVLWTDTFHCSIGHLFAIERKITQRVARSVGAADPGGSRARPGELAPAAAQAFIRGGERLRSGANGEAMAELQRAVDAEPAFALAHVRLAQAQFAARRFADARQSAFRALRIDYTLADAHHVLGEVALAERHDVVAAEHSLRRALALDPRNVVTREALSRIAALSR